MQAKDLRAWITAAAFAAVLPALAQTAPGPAPEACAMSQEEGHPLSGRNERIAQYERLPAPCLKEIFRQCTRAAGETLLDLDTAAQCSMGYEALLKQGFGGDFRALMAWWQQERSAPPQ